MCDFEEEPSDESIEALAERILDAPDRVGACHELCQHPSRRVRACALSAFQSLGPSALSTHSARAMLEILEDPKSTYGARASALDALRLHPCHLFSPHAAAVGALVGHPHWCCRAVGMQALELLDTEGLLRIAATVLRTICTLDWTLAVVCAPFAQPCASTTRQHSDCPRAEIQFVLVCVCVRASATRASPAASRPSQQAPSPPTAPSRPQFIR